MKENWFSKHDQWLYQSFECTNSQDEHNRRTLNFTGVYPEKGLINEDYGQDFAKSVMIGKSEISYCVTSTQAVEFSPLSTLQTA